MRAPAWPFLVVMACAAIASPARAASPKPPQGEEVVVARGGSVTLLANNDDDRVLCITVRGNGGSHSSCGEPDIGVVTVRQDEREPKWVGIAIPASAVSVELRRAGRLLATAATVAGLRYKGRAAGSVRFALVRLPAKAPEDGLRVFGRDGAGALVAALAGIDDELVLDRRPLLAGRAGALRWSLTSNRTSTLTPSVLDLAHESVAHCVEVSVRGGRRYGGGARACDATSLGDRLGWLGSEPARVNLEEQCTPRLRLVYGIVPASIRRVSVLLGDGRRPAARTARMHGVHLAAYALALPAGDAVRSVTLHARSGRPQILRLAVAPLSVTCARGSPAEIVSGSTTGAGPLSPTRPSVTPVGPVATLPGSPPIRVADGPADTLCVTFGDQPFTALGCGIVSPFLSEPMVNVDSLTDPHAFALVVPARVAAARVSGVGGRAQRTIAATAGTGYTGQYAGHVHFIAGTFGSPLDPARTELLDAAGAVLYRGDKDEEADEDDEAVGPPRPPKVLPPRRIAGHAGGPSLWQTTARGAGETFHCLALTRRAPPTSDANCQSVRGESAVLLDAACSTGRLTVAVAAPAGTRAVADTGPSGWQPVPLRKGAGLLTLSPRTPLRAVTLIRGKHRNRVAIKAPPAGRQCGWSTSLFA